MSPWDFNGVLMSVRDHAHVDPKDLYRAMEYVVEVWAPLEQLRRERDALIVENRDLKVSLEEFERAEDAAGSADERCPDCAAAGGCVCD